MVVEGRTRRLILISALLFKAFAILSAQEKERNDSLVRLVSADYIEQIEKGGELVRKAMNPVFLHNGTYLQSDSALWSQSDKIIDFYGNVHLIQGDAELTSETLEYLIDDNLAKFRGSMVQLRNKEDNTLRTNILDYNTKDSLAVFSGGASMRSADGQIIESNTGSYSSALALFTFSGDVEMYTDSVFVRTGLLDYDSRLEKAYFKVPIDFWKDDNRLSAGCGWYNRPAETFFFTEDVHALTPTQETWSDSLFYYRNINDVLMLGNVQLQDSTRSVATVSEYMYYNDSTARVTLTGEAAIALWEKKEDRIDTTYCGADTLVYYALSKCDIPDHEIREAEERLKAMNGDPVSEFRQRAAREAEDKKNRELNEALGAAGVKGAAPAARDGNTGPGPSAKGDAPSAIQPDNVPERKAAPESNALPEGKPVPDSTAMRGGQTVLDSLAVLSDSLALVPPDTTKVGFMYGRGRVKIFREDMQVVCDSVRFCELDSIVRFHIDPIIWNEDKRQYTADSLFVLVKKEGIDRADLMSNAFIAVQEDSVSFDQIKAAEVMAYFGADTELTRFDALGGVSCIFYMEENGTLATVDKIEGKMMSAILKDGEIDRVYYFDNIKNNLYPVVQLSESDRTLKGFSWRPDLKPAGKKDITDLEIKPSVRSGLERCRQPEFVHTDKYFPGYMASLREQLALARTRKRNADAGQKDSLALGDSTSVTDSLLVDGDSLALADSIGNVVSVMPDSVAAGELPGPAAQRKADRAARRAARLAKKEARWAELDARDAIVAAEKKRRKDERRRKREERRAAIIAKEEARENAMLQKYIEYYQEQKDRNERKQESQPARERASGAEAGGDLQTPAET